MAKEPTTIKTPPFLDVLFHSIEIVRIAETFSGVRASILAKSAILEAAFSIEALANSLLHYGNFSQYKEFEKLQPFAKFELFARSRGRVIDFGRHEYACADELRQLRNSYVHAKVSQAGIEMVRASGEVDEFTGKEVYGLGKNVKEPKEFVNLGVSSRTWTVDDAKAVIVKLVKFVDRLILTDCKLELGHIQRCLLPTADNNKYILTPTHLPAHQEWIRNELKVRSKLLEMITEKSGPETGRLKPGTRRK